MATRHRCLLASKARSASRNPPPPPTHPTPPHPPPPPSQLLDYITAEFKRIKRKQAKLLGIAKSGSSGDELSEEERREENRLEPELPRPPVKSKL